MSSSSSDEDEGETRPAAQSKKPCVQKLRETPIQRLLTYLRITNMINALLVLLVFPLGFITEALTLQISTAFFTGYSIIFALIIFIFECNCGSWQVRIRTNFGFLYSFVGRTAFLLFVASICLCAQTASGYFMFAITFLNATVNCVVLATHPAFKKGGQLSPFDDPTKVGDSLKDVGADIAAQNPSLVAKALKAATPSPEAAFNIIAKQVDRDGPAVEMSV